MLCTFAVFTQIYLSQQILFFVSHFSEIVHRMNRMSHLGDKHFWHPGGTPPTKTAGYSSPQTSSCFKPSSTPSRLPDFNPAGSFSAAARCICRIRQVIENRTRVSLNLEQVLTFLLCGGWSIEFKRNSVKVYKGFGGYSSLNTFSPTWMFEIGLTLFHGFF